MNTSQNTAQPNPMQDNAHKAESMLKMLANQKRLMILCHLVQNSKTSGELADFVDLSPSALSQHLSKLRQQGLVEATKQGKEVYYRICSMEAQAILNTLHLIYCR